MRIRLTVNGGDDIPDPTAVIQRIVSRTWDREGVAVEWVTDSNQSPWSTIDVWIAVVSGRSPRLDGDAAGEVLFNGGNPRPLIRIFVEATVEWVRRDEATRFGTDTRVLNLTIGDTRALLPYALAYVASHEFGHFVLGSSRHTATGLMQAKFRGAHRLLTSNRPMSLDPTSETTLRARLDAASACGK